MRTKEIFTIRQMIELTGLSEFTIRGWENRYSAFQPTRSESGRRKYKKTDIERALLLRELIKRGHKISQIAPMDNKKLQGLFEDSESKTHNKMSLLTNSSPLANEAMELMALQKWAELTGLLQGVSSENSEDLIFHFFLPVLTALSSRVNQGFVSISQEHIFSSLLKERIYSELASYPTKFKRSKLNDRFVLAAPEGDYHDLGLLLAHLLLRSHGLTSLYLGPHSPAADVAETSLRFEATHLLIVSTTSKRQGAKQDIFQYINDLQRRLNTEVKILVAGPQTHPMAKNQTYGFRAIESFFELNQYLTTLRGKN